MLAEEPRWTFASKGPLTQWYGHVCLLSDHVVGQWFCLTRESGELLWQRRFYRANDICGIDSGVIVASEMRSDGPWTCDFGCYGISLRSGSLLWVSHRNRIVLDRRVEPRFPTIGRRKPVPSGGVILEKIGKIRGAEG